MNQEQKTKATKGGKDFPYSAGKAEELGWEQWKAEQTASHRGHINNW